MPVITLSVIEPRSSSVLISLLKGSVPIKNGSRIAFFVFDCKPVLVSILIKPVLFLNSMFVTERFGINVSVGTVILNSLSKSCSFNFQD